MTKQTDFSKIAADFAAAVKPKTSPDTQVDTGGDVDQPEEDAAPDTLTQEAADAGRADPVTQSVDTISDASGRVASDTDAADAHHDAVDADAGPGEATTALPDVAQSEAAADDASDRDGESAATDSADAVDAPVAEVAAIDTDGGIFKEFPAAPFQPGEFKVPLCDLLIGDQSPSGVYDFDSGAGEALLHAVQTPDNIAPIVVMKVSDDWHVVDGWARVMAMRFQFGNTANLLVRVIEWTGAKNADLYNRFAATFLTLNSRKIDRSILLLQFHRAWNVPQLVLAARISWTESRVTRELAAAECYMEAPRFAELHVRAGDPPIDYLYKVQQARDAAVDDDKAHPKRAPEKGAVARLNAKLEALLAKSERFSTSDALAKLGITKPGKAKANAQTDEGAEAADIEAPAVIDCVEDSTGEAVAMVEMTPDQFPSIRLLVDTTTLDDQRKAEVRHLIHEALDKLLGF